MVEKGRSGAWGCEAFVENAGASGAPRAWRRRLGTPRSRVVNSAMRNQAGGESNNIPRKIAITSCGTAVCGRRGLAIREKIIGHDMPAIGFGFRCCCVHRRRRAVVLLHEPARHHGRSILLEPLVEQRADLLAQIRGVAQPRQLITLQTIPGSRQQEFPWRLGRVTGHGPFSWGTGIAEYHCSNSFQ